MFVNINIIVDISVMADISNNNTEPGTVDSKVKKFSDFKRELMTFFDVSGDLEPQSVAEEEIRSGVQIKGSQLLILIFAIFVASLGLNTNSIPVIIGAMLISPLMGPIIGIGLGLGIQDYRLMQQGLRNILMAMLGSILASALYFLISPQYGDSSQLLARTSPSIYDVFIALFGGAAGIVSIGCRNKGQVMPGVAIATSLMPPLCTAGYGLATLQPHFFFGALYLFFTNMLFILCASWIGVRLFGYKKKVYAVTSKARKISVIVYGVIAVTVGVSVYLTAVMIRESLFKNQATEFVKNEMVFSNTQVFSSDVYINGGKKYIDVNLIGAYLPKDSLELAMRHKLDSLGLGGAILNIKQGFSIVEQSQNASPDLKELFPAMQTELDRKQSQIDSLRAVISLSQRFSDESSSVAPEIKVLFPSVKDVALGRMVAARIDGGLDTLSVAFVKSPAGITPSERKKLTEYLEVRFKQKRISLLVNPRDFPW